MRRDWHCGGVTIMLSVVSLFVAGEIWDFPLSWPSRTRHSQVSFFIGDAEGPVHETQKTSDAYS